MSNPERALPMVTRLQRRTCRPAGACDPFTHRIYKHVAPLALGRTAYAILGMRLRKAIIPTLTLVIHSELSTFLFLFCVS